MDQLKSKIAEGLRSLRMERNWTQEYLADKLGKKEQTGYQRLESGRTDLKYEDAYMLSKLYQVPMEWIMNPDLRHQEDSGNNVVSEPPMQYGKKKQFQFTINLDGSDDNLEEQYELLKRINKVISQQY